MNERASWRVIPATGDPVPFATELAARTAAAIRSRDGRAPALVEYRGADGWRPAGPSAAELYTAAKRRHADARAAERRRHETGGS